MWVRALLLVGALSGVGVCGCVCVCVCVRTQYNVAVLFARDDEEQDK